MAEDYTYQAPQYPPQTGMQLLHAELAALREQVAQLTKAAVPWQAIVNLNDELDLRRLGLEQLDEKDATQQTQIDQLLRRVEELERWVHLPQPVEIKGDWHLGE